MLWKTFNKTLSLSSSFPFVRDEVIFLQHMTIIFIVSVVNSSVEIVLENGNSWN